MEILAILWLAFLTRILFLIEPQKNSTSDLLGSLYQTQRQKGHHWINERPIAAVQNGVLLNSPLSMWLTSRFPRASWMFVGSTISIGSDLLLIYGLFVMLEQSDIARMFQFMNVSAAGWGAILLAFSPALFPVTARLRGGIKARSLGLLICTCYLFFLYKFIVEAQFLYALVCVLLTPVIILSSIFGSQALLGIGLCLSIMYASWQILLILFLGLLLSGIPSPLKSHKVIEFKIAHYQMYMTLVKNGYLGTRNNLSTLLHHVLNVHRRPYAFCNYLLNQFSPFAALWSIGNFLLIIYFLDAFTLGKANLLSFSLSVFAATVLLFFITSFRRLLFLGEAERYFEFATPFLAFVAIAFVAQHPAHSWLLSFSLVISLTIIFCNYFFMNWKLLANQLCLPESPYSEALLKFLKEHDFNAVTFPLKMARSLPFYQPDSKVSYYQRLVFDGINGHKKAMEEIASNDYEMSDLSNLQILKERYKVENVVVDTRVASEFLLQKLSTLENIFDDGIVKIYKIQ